VGSYGLTGEVPESDANSVRRLQQIEIGAGAAFIGLAAWGVVDALVNYQPSVVRKPDETLLPPDMRPAKQPTARLAPTTLPGGGGVVMSWEF
jgi:hypothetical protein